MRPIYSFPPGLLQCSLLTHFSSFVALSLSAEGGENHIPCNADKEDVLLFFSDAIAVSHASAALQAALGAEDLASLHEHLAAASERRSSAGSSS